MLAEREVVRELRQRLQHYWLCSDGSLLCSRLTEVRHRAYGSPEPHCDRLSGVYNGRSGAVDVRLVEKQMSVHSDEIFPRDSTVIVLPVHDISVRHSHRASSDQLRLDEGVHRIGAIKLQGKTRFDLLRKIVEIVKELPFLVDPETQMKLHGH